MSVLRSNRGIAIIYVTLFLLVLGMLFVALGIDIGWMAYVRTQGQTTTDAAALRGAAAIPDANKNNTSALVATMAMGLNSDNTVMNQSGAISNADVVLCTGSADSPTCNGAVPPLLAAGVRVTRTYPTPLFLTRFINGLDSTNITVSSTAFLGGPSGLRPDLPVALCKTDIQYNVVDGVGTCIDNLPAEFSPNTSDNAGWWNLVGAGSSSADECKKMVKGEKEVPYIDLATDKIDLNNGEITSCLQEIEKRFKDCNATICAGPDSPEKEACTVILPVVDCQNSINNNESVLGFAAMCITQAQTNPNSVIAGTLNCNVKSDGALGGGPQFGIYAERPVLVK